MAKKKNGSINRPEAEKISRQITKENPGRQERLYGYDPGDDNGQGTPMA
ncbi:hypothetical protein [Desulforamulus reducens]|nr:hypothetical protein [Desulforamulus reducens]